MHDDTTTPEAPAPDEPPATEPAPAPAERLRVLFAAPTSTARPIHALRVGTFTDSYGRETTFSAEDLQTMAARLNAAAAKRRPPITERHDYGRAVGRMLSAATRYEGRHLYLTPRWLSEGERLLAEEVYDSFSIELERDDRGYQIIGGSLTNYPAVDGLHPVTLEAPAPTPTLVLPPHEADIDPAPPEPPASTRPTQEQRPMADEQPMATPAPETAPPPPAPPALNLSDPAIRAQFEQYTAEMQAMYQQQYALAQEAARQQARAEFERWKAEEARHAAWLAFAQHVTTPTVQRPTTIAYSAEQILDILSAPTAEKVQQLFQDALDGALLVSGRPAGSSRGEEDDAGAWQALVFSLQQTGLSQYDAIKAAARKRPDLFREQGGR